MPSGALHWQVTDNLTGEGLQRGENEPDQLYVARIIAYAKRWEDFAKAHCECFAGQHERGDDKQRDHLQLYLKLKSKHQFDWIKAQAGDATLHCEVARDPAHLWDYCNKGDTRVAQGWAYTLGERPPPKGSRTDLTNIKRAVETGGLWGAAQAEFTAFIKFSRGIQLYHQLWLRQFKRTWKTTVWVFTGPPGNGKSSFAEEIARKLGLRLHAKLCSDKWFDGYEPQEHDAVLLDDFSGSIPFSQLLRMMDRGECYIEVKGLVLPWLAKHLFITSNAAVQHWYEYDKKKHLGAITRRINYEWLCEWRTDLVPVPEGVGIMVLDDEGGPSVQGPKSPVILTAPWTQPPDFSATYHGDGKWDIVVNDPEITIE